MNRMRPIPRSRSLARHAGILLLISLGVATGGTRPDLAVPGQTLAALDGQGIVVRLDPTPASPHRLLAPQTTSTAAIAAKRYDPAHDLGPLFHDVQMAAIFADSKTFADASARQAPDVIVARYAALRGRRDFDLKAFVAEHFQAPAAPGTDVYEASPQMEDHIRALWRPLTRPPDSQDPWSTLIPLPNAYVVPGGRFREVYYWDAYFTMLGLIESGRLDLVRSMLDNFAYLVRTVGHVPNGNRTYYLGRSQPPYFAAMVRLYANATGVRPALRYVEALEAEHAFWMEGIDRLTPGTAHRRVVKLPTGAVMNRYWDDIPEPRPESYREDYSLGHGLPDADREAFYRNMRATAESGWDFSSRWMRDSNDLRTLETTALVPVDLNCLLYEAERMIAMLRRARGIGNDAVVARRFERVAAERKRTLLAVAYDPSQGFFFDVRWATGEKVTDRPTLAAAAPLYFGLATRGQGRAVAARLEHDFLKPGGFVTTTLASGQQWDAPNGWPPLEWLSIEGLRRYERGDLANTARDRWLALIRRTYASTGKMTEKYDVVDPTRRAGGGEYPTQDGFGWTNGVALALSAQVRRGRRVAAAAMGPIDTPVAASQRVRDVSLLEPEEADGGPSDAQGMAAAVSELADRTHRSDWAPMLTAILQ
jgi:alpha,alpha-trehalase